MAPVARTLSPGQHHIRGDSLAVLGQGQEAHEVDKTSGKVQLAAKLAGCVVIGERVVVVVKSFPCEEEKKEMSDRKHTEASDREKPRPLPFHRDVGMLVCVYQCTHDFPRT